MTTLNFSTHENPALFIIPTVAVEKMVENKKAYYFIFWRKNIKVEVIKSISNN